MSPLLLSFLLLPVPLQGTDREIVWQLDGTKDYEAMGHQMSLYGDWDLDGTLDLLVVGAKSEVSAPHEGGVHIVSGESGEIFHSFGPLPSMYPPSGTYSFEGSNVLAHPAIDADAEGTPDFVHVAPYWEYDSNSTTWSPQQAVYMRSGVNGSVIWVTKFPHLDPLDFIPCLEFVEFGDPSNPYLFVGGLQEQGVLLDMDTGQLEEAWDYSNDPNSSGWGSTVASGDFDGDGFSDLAVSAPFSSAAGLIENGVVDVFFSSSTSPFSFSGPIDGGHLGSILLCPGDINSDGKDDLGMSVNPDSTSADSFEVYESGSWSFMYGMDCTTDFSGEWFPHSVAVLPDIDGDSKNDWVHVVSDPVVGIKYLRISSGADGYIMFDDMWNPNDSLQDGAAFGLNLVAFPDANGNEFPEIIATSHLSNSAANAQGSSFAGAGVVYRFDALSSGGGAPGSGDQSAPGGSWGTHGSYSGGAGGQAGHAIAPLGGDLDGDGVDDVIVGVPFGGANGEGQVQILSGSSWSLLLAINPPPGSGAATFGWAVDNMGDFDGDGIPEIAIGAPDSDALGVSRTGMVWIWKSSTGFLDPLDRTAWLPEPDEGFGFSLASLDDVDGDGHADLVVGVPFWEYPQFPDGDNGRVEAFSGMGGWSIWGKTFGSPVGYGRKAHCGYSIAAVGDIGWGRIAVGIGVPGEDLWNASDRGQVMFLAGDDGAVVTTQEGSAMGDQFGDQVVGGFDWNLDSLPDVAFGMPGLDDWGAMLGAGNNVGGVRIHSGGSGAVLTEVRGDTEGGRMGGSSGGDISIGDVNGDGHPDIVVGQGGVTGSLRSPNPDAGMITIYSGLTNTIVYRRLGTAAGDFLGEAIQVVGDLDGDGISDIASGAPLADPQGLVDAGVVVAEVFDPYIRTQTTSLSASTFTSLRWELDFPASYSNYKYHTLISESGVGPSTIGSLEVPLTLDQRMWDTIFGDYPTDNNWIGPLNASGDATIVQGVPAGAAVSFIGKTLYLAVVLHKQGRAPVLSSTVMPLTILP
jgi:hypothetical protein